LKHEIAQLSAGIIAGIGIIAIVFLVALKAEDIIKPVHFILGMAISGAVLYLDSLWIDKHFVNGEWV
jgi:hypothetical protein